MGDRMCASPSKLIPLSKLGENCRLRVDHELTSAKFESKYNAFDNIKYRSHVVANMPKW